MNDTSKSSKIRTHLKDLSLLFGIPIGLILLLVAFIYIPRLMANPAYDFVYCSGYGCDATYVVDSSGKITKNDLEKDRTFDLARLYYFDTERGAARPISDINNTDAIRVDPTLKSPDGYILERGEGGGGFLFSGSRYGTWRLSKGLIAEPVTLDTSYSDKHFVGWVLPQ